ncbi:MAG: BlaI/MecI/CopY family transcriptional regulator [Syntrophomonadaceae bacterium]
MESIKRLPDSELELMMIIWGAGQPVTSAYIMDKLSGTRNWAHTTVLNFLSRLVERGFLETSRQGRCNYYRPLVAEHDYLQRESKSFLEKMHHSSVTNLVASLYDGDAISREDLEELKRFLKGVTEP